MKFDQRSVTLTLGLMAALSFSVIPCTVGRSQQETSATPTPPDYPPFEKVIEGYTKVESKLPDKGVPLCNVWTREKDGQMLLELPRDFASKKYFIAMTVSSGDQFAGLQAGDNYVYWRQYNKRLALIEPNVRIRSNGEPESKSSVKRLFTDKVLLDIPILTMVPRGGPLVDADALFLGNASKFFGPSVRIQDPQLIKIIKAKAFAKNVELAFEIVGAGGKLQTLHYSYSEVPEESSGYKPRKADQRVGYFVTNFTDLGSYADDKKNVRYITRWRLEKRDPSLKLSPPVTPIRFYIEHTTPVRYRRFVKQGLEYWNKAFEAIGFSDAVQVYYQDAKTGDFMDLDPEDVQYNFVRWLNNDVGTAIGPSRVHPITGEILDADIVLTDGWIRHFNFQFHDMMPDLAMEGMSPETVAWLGSHPNWDPRLRLAPNANREYLKGFFANQSKMPFAGHALTRVDSTLIGDQPFDGLVGKNSQVNGYCNAAVGKQMDMGMARLALTMFDEDGNLELFNEANADEPKKDDPKKDDPKADAKKPDEKKPEPKKSKEDLLDGMPESFIGPLLAELVAHEAGHTLGLRHNFKASSVYTLKEINSPELKGKKPLASSVMDYLPINMPFEVEGSTSRGDWTMTGIGPYDFWAIEYGYSTDESKLPDVLKRVGEPDLQYGTDEDTSGPDPFARRYDYTKEPLDYAENQMRLVKLYRSRLLDKFVKDGDSWGKARRGYELTLGEQMKSVSMMANWIGGAFVNRDKKGDPGNRQSLIPVAAERQRKALDFVFKNAFRDEAFGITPQLLERLTNDKWADEGMRSMGESTFPIHDRVLGYQASTLTMLMNPTTLRRVFDNEQLVPQDQDALTLPELMDKVFNEVWSELSAKAEGEVSARKPRVSSWRRNLQREHLERLIDLAMPTDSNAVTKPVTALALMQLRDLKRKIDATLEGRNALDPYSLAHLGEAQQRITKAIDAIYVYNMPESFGGVTRFFQFGQEPSSEPKIQVPGQPEQP
ncbi:MAG: zinc-dependent metalloprotease [Pirellula sp.]